MDDIVISFDIPAEPLNLNKVPGTAHGAREHRARKNLWLEAAYYAACAAFPGRGPDGRAMPPCDVFLSLPVLRGHIPDAHNVGFTLKPVLDGLVQAGVWPNDTREWVTTHEPDLRPVARGDYWRSKVYVRLAPRKEH